MSGYYGGVNRGQYAAHTHSIAAATTDPDVIEIAGALTLDSSVLRDPGGVTLNTCGAVGCDAESLNGLNVGVAANVVRGAAAKIAVVTGIPTVTGAPI